MVCLGVSMSRHSGSKVKKPKSVANLAQSKVFESLMLEACSIQG